MTISTMSLFYEVCSKIFSLYKNINDLHLHVTTGTIIDSSCMRADKISALFGNGIEF